MAGAHVQWGPLSLCQLAGRLAKCFVKSPLGEISAMLQHFFSLAMLRRLLPDLAKQMPRQTPERNLFGFSRTRTHIDLAAGLSNHKNNWRYPTWRIRQCANVRGLRFRSGKDRTSCCLAIPRDVEFFSTCWSGRLQQPFYLLLLMQVHLSKCWLQHPGPKQKYITSRLVSRENFKFWLLFIKPKFLWALLL